MGRRARRGGGGGAPRGGAGPPAGGGITPAGGAELAIWARYSPASCEASVDRLIAVTRSVAGAAPAARHRHATGMGVTCPSRSGRYTRGRLRRRRTVTRGWLAHVLRDHSFVRPSKSFPSTCRSPAAVCSTASGGQEGTRCDPGAPPVLYGELGRAHSHCAPAWEGARCGIPEPEDLPTRQTPAHLEGGVRDGAQGGHGFAPIDARASLADRMPLARREPGAGSRSPHPTRREPPPRERDCDP
jgi:hypothetical protein